MRIGKNELEIMRLLGENKRMEKDALRENISSSGIGKRALSRALYSLARKSLIAMYAQISEGIRGWRFASWTKDQYGNDAMLMKKPYDGKMGKRPVTKVFLGLTERGEKELQKRENRLSNQ
ncbi:hypothetical protein AKJ41_05410 [candidate division MSBL1 archaeon SCGC-AAA259O05]|uniref:Uncharacterized protein n=1 Tax=candidate division MSBL1 archaeon SCGC-AAA259O05 TaxID=1698271 RepID=A0A133UZ26_9EURY|nr:hypothetical protein AKJ41_05410 [candidate division MSBL1 archaeon SCGC-AAA259O05]